MTVRVCDPCNTGWLSRLEEEVADLLAPWVYDAQPVRLRVDHQRTVALWAVKTFMTYALTLAPQSNPFTAQEYAELAASQKAPSRAHVWMYASTSVRSAVGMGINTFTFSDGAFDPTTETDNAALGFLAAGHAMFLMVLVPDNVPERLVRVYALPPAPHAALMRRITRPKKGWLFPVGKCDEKHMHSVMGWMNLPAHAGMSYEGLTPQEKQQASKDFLEGASFEELRGTSLSRVAKRAPQPAELTASRRNSLREAKRLQARGQHEYGARALLESADLHIGGRDWSSALQLIDEALAIAHTSLGGDANVAAARGVCLTEMRHWPEAAAEHQRAIDLGHDTPEGRGDLADALTHCGQYAQALRVLEASNRDPDVPEIPRAELTRAALTHLVHDLGIAEQDREQPAELPDDLDSLSDGEIRRLLIEKDALAPELWSRRREAEETVVFFVARAWWGGLGKDWFSAAAVLHHSGFQDAGRNLIRLGFKLNSEMLNARQQVLDAMRTLDAPDVDELAVVWSQEAQRVSDSAAQARQGR